MRKMTICLILSIYILVIPMKVQANDNQNNTALPTEGVATIISPSNDYELEHEDYIIDNHNGKKTYMSYKAITDTSSNQYDLQLIAYTDSQGFRKIDERYCVAIGTAFNAEVGQYFDAILENGEIIQCVVGDIKADIDTDESNTFTSQGCCLEFIIDNTNLNDAVRKMGDCSYLCEDWQSPCVEYSIYNIYA